MHSAMAKTVGSGLLKAIVLYPVAVKEGVVSILLSFITKKSRNVERSVHQVPVRCDLGDPGPRR